MKRLVTSFEACSRTTALPARAQIRKYGWNAWRELSQGWSQHINRIAVAASRAIVEHGGEIRSEWLEQALQSAHDRKEDCYRTILRRCSGQPWVYKQLALVSRERDGVLGWNEIQDLTRFAQSEKG